MPTLYHCKTVYNTDPPSDINPLLLQIYKNKRILAIVAREQQATRIKNLMNNEQYQGTKLLAIGWWDLDKYGLLKISGTIDYAKLYSYDAVILVSIDRVDQQFRPLIEKVLQALEQK